MLRQSTQNLIQQHQDWYQSLKLQRTANTLHVDEIVSKLAGFYERVRGIIDWREEHLIRKTAIERILKRRLFLMQDGKELARPFLLELIRGGHFPNDTIPESKIEDIQKLIDKYIFILKNRPAGKEKEIQFYSWLLGIAACEVEETLSPPVKEKALIEYMADLMKERVVTREVSIPSEEEKNTQIFIAVQRALFKLDDFSLSYHFLEKEFPLWKSFSESELLKISESIYSIWEEITRELKHPLAEKFYQSAEKYDTAYLILGDIISQDPMAAQNRISDPENLENLVRETYEKRLIKTKKRIRRAAFYSATSIFVGKMLLAFTVEVGFDRLLAGGVDYFTLGLNIALPPFLMGLLILGIRPPAKENLIRVIAEVMKITYESEKKDIYQLKPSPKRGFLMNICLASVYLLSFLISFGIISWGLSMLNFSIISIIIFLAFLSLILFAATRIRQRAKELQISDDKESVLTVLFDFLTLPIVRVGEWLSSQWERYNVLIVFINLLIEFPFQFFTEFLEQLIYFWREKKDKIH